MSEGPFSITCQKLRRTECETGLETEVDVGGSDNSAEDGSNNEGTNGQLMVLDRGEGVNREGVDAKGEQSMRWGQSMTLR